MRSSLVILLTSLSVSGFCQNLVLNPFFIPTKEPRTEDQLYLVPGYSNANKGTTDLYSRFANKYEVGIPQNFTGWQEISGSDHYAGIIAYYGDQTYAKEGGSILGYGKYSEYLQVELREPLKAGHKYRVSFDASLSENSAYASTLGLFVSANKIMDQGNQMLQFTPQIESSTILTDKVTWTKTSGIYTAAGGEKFVVIGRYTQALKQVVANDAPNNLRAYYYLSNVVVEDNEEVALSTNPMPSQPKMGEPEVDLSNFSWPTLNFETNRNAIEVMGYEDLNKLSAWMKANPSARISIEGHTDKVGNAAYNLSLSNSRAHAAKKYLISKGIDAARMETKGTGFRNLAEPSGPANNLKNRRVTITLISK
ncbi:MAG: OmpA family protein [Bacteroidota bacterium]